MNTEIYRFSHDQTVNGALKSVPPDLVSPDAVLSWAFLKHVATGDEAFAHWSILGEKVVYPYHGENGERLLQKDEAKSVFTRSKSQTKIAPENLGQAIDLLETVERNITPVSLNFENAEGEEMGELISDRVEETVEILGVREALKDMIETLMDDNLSQQEKDIVKRRVGWDGASQTLEEIGRVHGVTRERIRQIEKKALTKLLPAVSAKKLNATL